MSTDRLQQAFQSGALLHPISERPGFVDLTHALAKQAGIILPGPTSQSAAVADFIGAADHLVFILVDGMGLELLDLLVPTAFLRAQKMMELRAIFPSTTGCALPTLATGLWPGQHGAPGWWAYLENRNLSITTLPFQERFTETPLSNLGVAPDEIWPFEPWQKTLPDAFSIIPHWFPESEFSRYSRGYTPGIGYKTIPEAMELVVRRIEQVTRPSFTYLYLPEFDAACHQSGVDSPQAMASLHSINLELERLASKIGAKARIVISADHGHANVDRANQHKLFGGDSLLGLLKVPPTSEPRGPVFHVRDGCQAEFEAMFHARFGEAFVLLTIDQIEALHLLGPGPLSPLAKKRFGDYMGIAIQPATLKYKAPQQKTKPDHIGYHAGLTPAEMRTPLMVI